MGADGMRSIGLEEAVKQFEAIDLALRPATLDPRYVQADASRDPKLQPAYLMFESGAQRWLHSLHLTDIPGAGLRDASSPYGYGGPVSSSSEPTFLAQAWDAYSRWMRQQRVVVEYIRFHPVLVNERWYGGAVSDNRMVVWVDLGAGDVAAVYPARLRQVLNKAQRAGLAYREAPLAAQAAAFGAYYRAWMADIGADPSFLFPDAYFELLAATGFATLGVCQRTGESDGPWLAACLFLQGRGLREYHLAATSAPGRAAGASPFALHQGALAAQRAGLRKLYLGGGSDVSRDNSLLFFKSAFSPDRLGYRTGSCVFDPAAYDGLKQQFAAGWAAHPERPIFHRRV